MQVFCNNICGESAGAYVTCLKRKDNVYNSQKFTIGQ